MQLVQQGSKAHVRDLPDSLLHLVAHYKAVGMPDFQSTVGQQCTRPVATAGHKGAVSHMSKVKVWSQYSSMSLVTVHVAATALCKSDYIGLQSIRRSPDNCQANMFLF